jgi:protein-S-isoprenylcysteine O-methyltransferase Ste14
MSKIQSAITAVLAACVYIVVVAAIFIFSANYTPWAVPHSRDIQLLGASVSYQQLMQAIIGLPLFVYGALLVQKTTAVNHTAQNRESRKPEKLLTHDVYAVRRHPMYTGFICLQAGLWSGAGSLIGYLIGSIIILIITVTSPNTAPTVL